MNSDDVIYNENVEIEYIYIEKIYINVFDLINELPMGDV